MNKDYWKGWAIGTFATLGGALGIGIYTNSNYIPQIKQVEQGYIAPSKLEIECKDLDGNGEPETIMKIGDKPYLLREVNGKPLLTPYEIKPAEIILKK